MGQGGDRFEKMKEPLNFGQILVRFFNVTRIFFKKLPGNVEKLIFLVSGRG